MKSIKATLIKFMSNIVFFRLTYFFIGLPPGIKSSLAHLFTKESMLMTHLKTNKPPNSYHFIENLRKIPLTAKILF